MMLKINPRLAGPLALATVFAGCATPPAVNPSGSAALSCMGDPAAGVIAQEASHVKMGSTFFREGSRFQLRNLNTEEAQVLFNGKPIFDQCSAIAREIDSEARARQVLQLAGPGHWQKLVGTRVFACRNDRAGWFFFLRERGGYIGYAGKRQLPLFLVGITCEPESPLAP